MSKLTPYEHAVRAIVYADSPEKQQRITAEAKTMDAIAGLAMRASYAMIYRHSEVAKKILSFPYEVKGLDVVAFGRNSTVIRQGEDVLKIARASEDMSDSERSRLVDELKMRHTIAAQYLGNICIEQFACEMQHPLRSVPIVASVQPFVPFRPFRGDLPDNLEQRALLADMAYNSQRMEAETGFVNDTSGTNNFGFTEDGCLVVVDTIPLKASDGGPSVAYSKEIIEQLAACAASVPVR